MEYRRLGKTGLKVSCIALGTVELGMDYGIEVPGEFGKPDKRTAERILHKALDFGINLFDTASTYGDSESLLGSAIGGESCYIATKVNIPFEGYEASGVIRNSIERSLKNLRREYLDILQIHNATAEILKRSDVLENLLEFRKKGLARFIGASVYETRNALAVIESGCLDIIQIAFNVLDQSMAKNVIPKASEAGVGVLSRSTYLKGVLTSKVEFLTDKYEVLINAISDLKDKLYFQDNKDLTEFALRYCVSTPGIDSVIVGVRTESELDAAIEIEGKGKLADNVYKKALSLGIKDEYWLNPANWPN